MKKNYNLDVKIIMCHDDFNLLVPATYLELAIREVTDSKFNHGLVIFKDYDNKYYVLHATQIGVNILPLKTYLNYHNHQAHKNREHYIVTNATFDLNLNIELGKSLLGSQYQFGIFRQMILYHLSKNLFGSDSNLTRYFSTEEDNHKWFCFEVIAKMANIKNPWLITGRFFEENCTLERIDLNKDLI